MNTPILSEGSPANRNDFAEKLAAMIRDRPDLARLEWLTSDANPDAAAREGYRQYVLGMGRPAASAVRSTPLTIRVDYGTDPTAPAPRRSCCNG